MQVRTLGLIMLAVGALIFLWELDLLSADLMWIMAGLTVLAIRLWVIPHQGLVLLGWLGVAWGVHLHIHHFYGPQMYRPMLFLILGLGAVLAYLTEAILTYSSRWLLWVGSVLLLLAGVEVAHVWHYRVAPGGLERYWPIILVALGLWLVVGGDGDSADGCSESRPEKRRDGEASR